MTQHIPLTCPISLQLTQANVLPALMLFWRDSTPLNHNPGLSRCPRVAYSGAFQLQLSLTCLYKAANTSSPLVCYLEQLRLDNIHYEEELSRLSILKVCFQDPGAADAWSALPEFISFLSCAHDILIGFGGFWVRIFF